MTSQMPSHLFFSSAPSELLLRVKPGDSVFVSPHQSLLGAGAALEQRWQSASPDVAGMAASLLEDARRQGWGRAVLMGAVPFRPESGGRLVVPRYVEIMTGGRGATTLCSPSVSASPSASRGALTGVRMAPSPQRYRQMVADAVGEIRSGTFEKVVLSRSLRIDARIDLPGLLSRLAVRHPQAYIFGMDQGRSRHMLVGASPELLLSKSGKLVISHPLAGSIPRSGDAAEDRRRGLALLCSAKDRHEHALVVDAVADALRPWCRHLSVPEIPALVTTPTMLHLGSEIRGELKDPGVSSLQLALCLHPTPAVCGHPTMPALDFITRHEGFDRGPFTGLVGWCDLEGNGEWAVTIRCAEVEADAVTLYAGAGVVEASDPDAELAETSAKMRTMLAAMDLEYALEAV